jgi:hypothetical protein
MADAQDLKMKKWLFLPVFSDCLSSDVLLEFSGENSFLTSFVNVPLPKAKSGTKSGTHA